MQGSDPPAEFFYRNDNAPTPEKIGVGALALIEHDGRLLMELRSDCELWGLPGGAVEPDEDIEYALHREVFEETNLKISTCELFGVFTDASRIVAYPDGNVVRLISFVYLVMVEEIARSRRSEESLSLRFIAPDELYGLDAVATAIPVLDEYLSAEA